MNIKVYNVKTLKCIEINVYSLDTLQSLHYRISIALDTLYEYIVVTDITYKYTLDKYEKILNIYNNVKNKNNSKNIVDLFSIDTIYIRNVKDYFFNCDQLYFSLEHAMLFKEYITLETIEEIFINTHALLKNDVDIFKYMTNLNTNKKPDKNWMNSYNERCKKNKNIYDSLMENILYFDHLDSVSHDRLQLSSIQKVYRIKNNKALTIYDLFNSSICTSFMPYIFIKDTYKIYKNFVPYKFLSEYNPKENIIYAILNISKVNIAPYYTSILLTISNNDILLILNTTYKNVINIIQTMRILKKSFPSLTTVVEEEYENKVIGNITFNSFIYFEVFQDLIINNQIINKLFYIDEFYSETKKKNIILKTVNTPGSFVITLKENQIKSISDNYRNRYSIYCKCTMKNRTILNNYRKILSKVFKIYEMEEYSIITYYKKYISNFLTDVEEEYKKKMNNKIALKDIAPDIFLPTYSRQCLKKPTIINNVSNNTNEDFFYVTIDNVQYQVMKFPKYGEDNIQFYICDYDKYKYPGLKKNNLTNKNRFPYLPCCYNKDQINNPKTLTYFLQENIKTKINIQNISITNKILHSGYQGVLSNVLYNFFILATNDVKYSFLKYGTSSPYSFIECLLLAFNVENIRQMNMKEKKMLCQKYSKKIKNNTVFDVFSQENFYMSEAEKDILKEQYYLSNHIEPLYFLRLFEIYFQCNIFLFGDINNKTFRDKYNKYSDEQKFSYLFLDTKNKIFSDINIIIPNYKHYYVKEKYDKCIFLYYFFEKEKNNFKDISHCELIFQSYYLQQTFDVDTKCIFYKDDELYKEMWKLWEHNFKCEIKTSTSYFDVTSKILKENNIINIFNTFPNFLINNIHSQTIDPDGKCRSVIVTFMKNKINIVFEFAQAPFNVPLNNNFKRITDYKIIENFISQYNLKIIKYVINDDNYIKEIIFSVDNINNNYYYILTNINNVNINVDNKLYNKEKWQYFNIKEEKYDNSYLFYKKLVIKVLLWNSLWSFYQFLIKNNYNIYSNNNLYLKYLEKFKETVIINKNYTYNIRRNINYLTEFLNDNLQITVHNEIIRKKILNYIYVHIHKFLKIFSKSNNNAKNNILDHAGVFLFPHETIFNKKNLYLYVLNQSKSLYIYSFLIPNKTYLFRNKDISLRNMYLVIDFKNKYYEGLKVTSTLLQLHTFYLADNEINNDKVIIKMENLDLFYEMNPNKNQELKYIKIKNHLKKLSKVNYDEEGSSIKVIIKKQNKNFNFYFLYETNFLSNTYKKNV
jgi:hypothetical protein